MGKGILIVFVVTIILSVVSASPKVVLGQIDGTSFSNVSNSSNFWDDADTYNETQMNVTNNTLSINIDWLTTFITSVVNTLLGDYVPYTGADQNVDLGVQNFTTNGTIKGGGVYGEVYGTHIGEVDIASSDVYYNVTNLTEGFSSGFTFNTTGSSDLTANHSGIYSVDSQWAFSGGVNTEYHLTLSINGTQNDKCHSERVIGTGGDVGSASFTCLISLSEGDWVNLMIENVDSAVNPEVHDINLNLVRVGNL